MVASTAALGQSSIKLPAIGIGLVLAFVYGFVRRLAPSQERCGVAVGTRGLLESRQ